MKLDQFVLLGFQKQKNSFIPETIAAQAYWNITILQQINRYKHMNW